MKARTLEKFFASGIYLLMGISAGYIFSVGLANGIGSGYHYPIQQKLLIGAALTGAFTLMLSAILVHFRPAAAYGIATVATLLLWLAFWPLIAIINQGGSLRSFRRDAAFSGYDLYRPAAAQIGS